jgi:hypothetical protein
LEKKFVFRSLLIPIIPLWRRSLPMSTRSCWVNGHSSASSREPLQQNNQISSEYRKLDMIEINSMNIYVPPFQTLNERKNKWNQYRTFVFGGKETKLSINLNENKHITTCINMNEITTFHGNHFQTAMTELRCWPCLWQPVLALHCQNS